MIFFLYYSRNKYPYHRFAISINRKVGNSVQRNFIKRKMKELFRLNQGLAGTKYDFWIVMKKRFGREQSAGIEQMFIDALVKIESNKR